jgi:hypothetical protein
MEHPGVVRVGIAPPANRYRRPAMLLGDDLLEWILLAMGGALFVGNVLALVRPPANRKETDLERAPVLRSLLYAFIGLVAAVWALASLLVG